MFSNLSARQRTSLVSLLLLAGEASVVAGIFLGWSAAAVISASTAFLATAILLIVTGPGCTEQVPGRARRPHATHGRGRPDG